MGSARVAAEVPVEGPSSRTSVDPDIDTVGQDEPRSPTEESPASEDASAGPPGRLLRPITVEIIREELERKRTYTGELVDQYFPAVAARGSVEDSDIWDMTMVQADAVMYSLTRGFRSFSRDSSRLRSQGDGLPLDNGLLRVNHYEINARQYAIALRDLCDRFGISLPL